MHILALILRLLWFENTSTCLHMAFPLVFFAVADSHMTTKLDHAPERTHALQVTRKNTRGQLFFLYLSDYLTFWLQYTISHGISVINK